MFLDDLPETINIELRIPYIDEEGYRPTHPIFAFSQSDVYDIQIDTRLGDDFARVVYNMAQLSYKYSYATRGNINRYRGLDIGAPLFSFPQLQHWEGTIPYTYEKLGDNSTPIGNFTVSTSNPSRNILMLTANGYFQSDYKEPMYFNFTTTTQIAQLKLSYRIGTIFGQAVGAYISSTGTNIYNIYNIYNLHYINGGFDRVLPGYFDPSTTLLSVSYVSPFYYDGVPILTALTYLKV